MTFGTPTDIHALLGLLGSPAGLVLNSNISNNQVQIVSESPITPGSPSLKAELKRIINHPTQYAELVVARGQSHVLVGAFPPPEDLNIAKVQKIDIDDILAIEAKTPGSGVAVAAHEIEENFQLHKTPKATTVPANKRRTAQAHEQAIKSESAIAEELVGPGQRVAHDLVTTGPGTKVFAIDYSNYYLVVTINASADVLDSRRTRKIVVSSQTISNFTFNSDDVPAPDVAAALATIANVADDVMMNKPSTVLIEGFTDNVGNADVNLLLSKRRAEKVKRTLVSALVDRGKNASTAWKQIQIEGRGKTNFVAPNDTPLHRAQNRRVVITVMRPDL
jgi:outer membrane protein OmpA-like peptidoglycan-associated protein